MCGRFSLGRARNEIQQVQGHPDIHIEEWIDQDNFVPRYNIAPHSQALVLRRRDGASSRTGANDSSNFFLQTMRWGLVPHWAKHEDKSLNTINARSENLVTGGGMWGPIKGKKRCIVLAEGYYEWLKKGKERLPYFTKHGDGKIMLLAGLYDCTVLEGEKDPIWTFTIVTTMANKDFEWLHERQPVILYSQTAVDIWLDTSSQTWTDKLTKLVEPYHDPSSPLECYSVPKEVGRVGTESRTFIEPLSLRKDGIPAMFSRMKESSPQKRPPNKRKRTISPPPITLNLNEAFSSGLGTGDAKRPKDDRGNGLEDVVSSISVEMMKTPPRETKASLKDPETPPRVKSNLKVPAKATPLKKSPKKVKAPQGNKITTFFSKA